MLGASSASETVAALQATYGGTPEHLAEWLDPYVDAGVPHVVLRVADEDHDRGLETAAAAIRLPAAARSR